MTYGRSLQRHLAHFNLPTAFTEWAPLAQDRAGWRKLVTKPPFTLGKPFVRQPRGDTRVTRRTSSDLLKSARLRSLGGGRISTPPSTEEINLTQQHHELFPTHTRVMHEALLHKNALIGFTTHAYSVKRLALLRLHLPTPPSHLTSMCVTHARPT